MFKWLNAKFVAAICLTVSCNLGAGGWASGHEGLGTCGPGEVESVLHAFYPGVYAVDRLFIGEDFFFFAEEKPAGLGEGSAHCQFRVFAAEPWAVFLPDTWTFCEGDPFLGGIVNSIAFNDPSEQALLESFFSQVRGAYRQKAIALLSLLDYVFFLKRLTYFDDSGMEHSVGSGELGAPALTDPTAGEPKLQETLMSTTRSFFDGHPASKEEAADKKLRLLVQTQWAFIAQLEAGTYESLTTEYIANFPPYEFAPVTLEIVPCP